MVTFRSPTPALPSADVRRSEHFYTDVLGFDIVAADEGFALVRRDGATISIWGASDESWREQLDPRRPVSSGAESFIAGTASCGIEVTNIGDLFEQCSGRDIVHPNAPLHDTDWGTREFAVLDPDGNLVTFWESRA
jgi:catechol 2,3-dioxygenase-like lactoylglutathione lyase family enzyme